MEEVFGVVDRFTAGNPGYVELSDRAIRSWAIAGGLESKEEGCPDDLDFSFGVPRLVSRMRLRSPNCCAKTVVLD